MTRSGSVPVWVCTLLLAATGLTAQQAPLRVVSVGPEGPLDSLAQANEIRVVFSEPMVTLGRIPRKCRRLSSAFRRPCAARSAGRAPRS